jgi:hypothetical protein
MLLLSLFQILLTSSRNCRHQISFLMLRAVFYGAAPVAGICAIMGMYAVMIEMILTETHRDYNIIFGKD